MVCGEDLWPGPCCLLGQFPETVKHSCFQGSLSCAYAEAMPEHTAHFPRPTVPDLREGWSVGWWRVRGQGSGVGLRGQLGCIQGQSVV